MIVSRWRGTGLVALAAALALASCSSSGGGGNASTTPEKVGTNSNSIPTPSTPSPSASGTPADAATRKAINDAYATFFGYKSTLAQSQAALQHGAQFTKTLQEQGKSSLADKSTASVTSARVAGNVGYVTFTIAENGSPLLTNMQGYAVREGGTWKVAARTFCALLRLQGSAPSQCNDPTITALPH